MRWVVVQPEVVKAYRDVLRSHYPNSPLFFFFRRNGKVSKFIRINSLWWMNEWIEWMSGQNGVHLQNKMWTERRRNAVKSESRLWQKIKFHRLQNCDVICHFRILLDMPYCQKQLTPDLVSSSLVCCHLSIAYSQRIGSKHTHTHNIFGM